MRRKLPQGPQPAGPSDARLVIDVTRTPDGSTILFLTGEFDVHTVNSLCDTVVFLIEAGSRCLRLDLSGVTWCDNGSLYTLLGLRDAVLAADGYLALSSTGWPVAEAIARNRLWQLLRR
ncbi:STAS domain-containing protein [Streptomyces rimosus]|uniref:STAS domain-containing protein n=1 Tax=Streptomyces rimosus TaxID=1927 RepID=UPI00131BDA09|nr:STAS domain-containing protein [Streptomyces rimosus]